MFGTARTFVAELLLGWALWIVPSESKEGRLLARLVLQYLAALHPLFRTPRQEVHVNVVRKVPHGQSPEEEDCGPTAAELGGGSVQ